MPAGTLDDQYFTWLYSQVADVKTRKGTGTYWNLLRHLFSTEFTWFVPNDDNRAEDGRELRIEWTTLEDVHVDRHWMTLGCSFLEMLIGLARRLEFQTDRDVEYWFWHLLTNLRLLGYNDRSRFSVEEVNDRTSMVMQRTYDRFGDGGLFPLRRTTKDQRKVEIWYQLHAYLLQDM
jgi:hypothetical protein